MLEPTQTEDGPVGADGFGLTVNAIAAAQPVPKVYEIVVLPVATPETVPEVPMLATSGLLLLHVPPDVASVNVVVRPRQTLFAPPIAAGFGFTVIGNVVG